MTWPELPPRAEVIDAVKFAVLPAAAAAWVAFPDAAAALRRLGLAARRANPAGAVLALLVAVGLADWYRAAVPLVPDGSWWHWVGPACAAAALAELLARLVAVGWFGLLVRVPAAALVGWVATPADWQQAAGWTAPAVAAVVLANSLVVAAAGRRSPVAVTLALSGVAGGASGVLLHHKTIGFADVATVLAVALTVLAARGWQYRTDPSAAAAVATVPLTAYLVSGRYLSDTAVPLLSFQLLGLAPLLLGLVLWRPNRWLAAVPLLPVGWAVYRAMADAPLQFGENW